MEVDIYKVQVTPDSKERVFIFIPKGKDIESLPSGIFRETEKLIFRKTINIKSGEKRIALDSDEAINNINKIGYHIQGSKIETFSSANI